MEAAEFAFFGSQIKLLASDTLSGADNKNGFDLNVQQLVYQIHLIGQQQLAVNEIRRLIEDYTSEEISHIEDIEPTGGAGFDPHRWMVAFTTTECPKKLYKIRHLAVTKGSASFGIYVHHPATTKFVACAHCYAATQQRRT